MSEKCHSIRLPQLKKQIYVDDIHYLPYEHAFQIKGFDGNHELEHATKSMSMEAIYNEVKYNRVSRLHKT